MTRLVCISTAKKLYANGGRTTGDNAQLVHPKCNQSKGAKEP